MEHLESLREEGPNEQVLFLTKQLVRLVLEVRKDCEYAWNDD